MKFIKKILRLLTLDLFKLFKVVTLGLGSGTRGMVLADLDDTEIGEKTAATGDPFYRPLDCVGEFETSQETSEKKQVKRNKMAQRRTAYRH